MLSCQQQSSTRPRGVSKHQNQCHDGKANAEHIDWCRRARIGPKRGGCSQRAIGCDVACGSWQVGDIREGRRASVGRVRDREEVLDDRRSIGTNENGD